MIIMERIRPSLADTHSTADAVDDPISVSFKSTILGTDCDYKCIVETVA